MKQSSKIYVAGHNGMVGSAIIRQLYKKGYENIIGKTINELDLTRQADVESFFEAEKPDIVFLVAAKVGGVADNRQFPAEYLIDNTYIELNVIRSAFSTGCKHLLFISSNCIYPQNAPLPLKEESFMDGKLDSDWEGYGISKIVGAKLCQYYNVQYGVQYISAVPCNLYGINDCFDPAKSRVVAALIRRFHEAKINNADSVEIWGDGSALREFLFADDLAEACLFLIDNYKQPEIINVSSGIETSIKEIAYIIKDTVGYNGDIVFNTNKPGGISRKNMSCEKINMYGWKAKTDIKQGIKTAYSHFVKKYS